MKKNILLFILCVAIAAGCKKKSSSTPAASSNPTGGTAALSLSTPGSLTATIGGASVSYAENSTYEGIFSSNKNLNPPSPSTAVYSYGLSNISTSADVFGVSKGTLTYTGSSIADQTTFNAFFPISACSYSPNAANGIEFQYWIGATLWSTSLGTADQTGSAFTVTDRVTGTVLGYSQVKIKATFNCKIYDGSGNSKTVTGGTMIVDFESD